MKVYQLAEKIRKDVEMVQTLLAERKFTSRDPFDELPDDLAAAMIEAYPVNLRPQTITLSDFKAFGHEEEDIPLKPLTLIFGPNSAGKSSFLHSQLWLHHAFETGELDIHRPIIAGDLVDLGGLRNVIYKKQADGNTFTFSYSFPREALSVTLRDFFGPMLNSLHLEFTVTSAKQMVYEGEKELSSLVNGSISRIAISTGDEKIGLLRASRRRTGAFKVDYFPLTSFKHKHAWSELIGGLAFYSSFNEGQLAALRQLFQSISSEIELDPADTPLLPKTARFVGETPDLKKYQPESKGPAYDEYEDESAREPQYEDGDLNEAWINQQGEDEYVEEEQDPQIDYSSRPLSEESALDHDDGFYQTDSSDYGLDAVTNAIPNMVALTENILGSLLSESNKLLRSYLDTLHYLGSQRAYPERGFTFNTRRDINWKANGGEAWDRLTQDGTLRDKVNLWLQEPSHLKTPYKLAMRKFVDLENTEGLIEREILDQMEKATDGLVDEYPEKTILDETNFDAEEIAKLISLKAVESGEVESYSDLYLIDTNSNTIVSHRDVGVGITQLIPILATAMSLEGKTVLIEEPESHLHPKAQTELADVFIQSALGDGPTNTFIIETHSEHFILRVLRRIRECYESPEDYPEGLPKISPQDVSVIYMDPGKAGARAHVLRISEDGDFLDKWPAGFFEERREELF